MMLLGKLEKNKSFWFLLVTSTIFFLFRLPSLFEPYWYGDEGVYQTLGLAIRNGRLLYRDIWDNKPPLLYTLYSIFNSDQFLVRLVSLIFGVISVILFFHLCKRIFNRSKTAIITTSVFALLFSIPLLEGNIANAENFMLLPIISAALILTHITGSISQRSQNKDLLLIFSSGLLLGIAFLFKIVAVFDFAAFSLFILFIDGRIIEHLKNRRYLAFEVKKIIYFIGGFIILPFLTAIFFLLNGAISQFLKATFLSNIGYVGYGNKLLIPQGFLILKLSILLAFIYYIFRKRGILGMGATLVLLWFSFSLFNAFFSQRPYTHYLLVLIPSFALLIGIILESLKYRIFLLAILLVSLIIILKNFTFYTKVFPYYENFLSFVMGEKSVSEYQGFFDRSTPVDYELAMYVNTHSKPQDYIFTWGNNAQLYKLTNKLPPGRYTVAYHITGSPNGISETERDINLHKPKIIIVMPYMNFFPFSLSNYSKKIIINDAIIYERTF
ncbi:MAG TPA: glycosyltransferase family 39 protein [Patescibacteria group bacterium]|nr:glycosyltransferase family 39 protein [Patescibacteria group bacterium]